MGWESYLPYLVHLAALTYLVCFLFRDQVYLRAFAIIGDGLYALFYLGTIEDPLWAMAYSLLNMVVNIVMISRLLHDRRERPLDDQALLLYQQFTGMTPGDFRRLLARGHWMEIDAPTRLCEEGQGLERLYYVVAGEITITRSGREIPAIAPRFIGEIAWLQKTPATATVSVAAGSRVIWWPATVLTELTTRHEGLRQSLAGLISSDLARKVAQG